MYADGPEEVWITSVSRACERLPLQMVPSVAPLSWATQVPRPQCHAMVMPLVAPEKTETPVEQTWVPFWIRAPPQKGDVSAFLDIGTSVLPVPRMVNGANELICAASRVAPGPAEAASSTTRPLSSSRGPTLATSRGYVLAMRPASAVSCALENLAVVNLTVTGCAAASWRNAWGTAPFQATVIAVPLESTETPPAVLAWVSSQCVSAEAARSAGLGAAPGGIKLAPVASCCGALPAAVWGKARAAATMSAAAIVMITRFLPNVLLLSALTRVLRRTTDLSSLGADSGESRGLAHPSGCGYLPESR